MPSHTTPRSLVRFIACFPVAWLAGCQGGPAPADTAEPSEMEPRTLAVTLKPIEIDGRIERLNVELVIPEPNVKAGEQLIRMPTFIVSTPTAAYSAEDIAASDATGPVGLSNFDEEPTPTGNYRQFLADRDTVGDVRVRYGTPPREVNKSTRNGPLFDLRRQDGGLMGAGVYFMAVPESDDPFKIDLDWDLSATSPGTRAISSYGEGDLESVRPASTLAFSFYAIGPVKSEPPDGEGEFGLYWLVDPPFDVAAIAVGIRELYEYMSDFFNDKGNPYRVFIRANPYPAGGGTALPQSFMFGFGSNSETTPGGQQLLIAHEMAHNWPRLDGDEHGLTSWYTEGTAEFYSVLLARRSGVIDDERFLGAINDKAKAYYVSPYINFTNAEAAERYWSDSRAQRVPYGRGFMYFARLDGQMRRASGGERSVDDLVREVLAGQKAGESVGIPEWIELVKRELGEAAAQEFHAMTEGELIVPDADSFGRCYRPEETTARSLDLGYDRMRMAVISDLRPDSAAAAAGVQEGDVVISSTPLDLITEEEKLMKLVIQRGDEELTFEFDALTAPQRAWVWQRVADVPDAECGL